MHVRMITLMAGPEGVVQPGTVLDLGPPEAQRLIEGGYAAAAGPLPRVPATPPSQETAAVTVPETPVPGERPAAPRARRKG